MANPLEDRVWALLQQVKFPGMSRDIVSFGLVHDVAVRDGAVSLRLELTTAGADVGRSIAEEARRALESLEGVTSVDIDLQVKAPPPTRLPSASAPAPRGLLGYFR